MERILTVTEGYEIYKDYLHIYGSKNEKSWEALLQYRDLLIEKEGSSI
jgi:hypothetical protein